MKTKLCGLIFLLAAAFAGAQTNNLTALLQSGLFEEQANRNLDAAIADYSSLATQFDKDRQLAATAVFRLGECYRAQGKTNEAAAQYQRILRDFSNEQTLATLSRQNLVGMGNTADTSAKGLVSNSSALSELEKEFVELKSQLEATRGETNYGLVAKLFGDTNLGLIWKQLETSEAGAADAQRFGATNIAERQESVRADKFYAEKARKDLFDYQELRLRSLAAAVSQAGGLLTTNQFANSAAMSAGNKTTDEEDQEIQRIQQMIQNSPDLINTRVDGGTPLSKAAAKGWLKVATYLMDHGADVDSSYALSAAVNSGNRAMVELLLSRGADMNSMDNSFGLTLLQTAVGKGYQNVAEVLLANKADVNKPDNSGNTPLDSAAEIGQLKIVKMLLASGANPNAGNNDGRTPLSFAADRGSPEMVKLLLDAKADPNGGKLDAPLLGAIYRKNLASAELLLQAGANPNAAGGINLPVRPNSDELMNRSGHLTPLWLAIYTKQLPMVQLLLKFKADLNGSQTDGMPLLFSALTDTNILKLLLGAGANPNSSKDGSILFAAIDKPEALKLLLNAGVEPNAKGAPLASAIYSGKEESVALLVQSGADVNAPGFNGMTPLQMAVWAQNLPMISLLLSNKVDINARHSSGRTALAMSKYAEDGTSPNSPGDYGGSFHQSDRDLARKISALLREHGALDKLPDWDRITVSRPSANFSQAVFQKGTNDWNQFTLLETILNYYNNPTPISPRGVSFQQRLAQITGAGYSGNLAFPDLAQIVIVRHSPGTTNETRIKADLLDSTNGIDCAKDVRLEFGDVVEIPERNHALGDQAVGLTYAEQNVIADYLKGNVQIVAHGQKVEIPIYPNARDSEICSVIQNNSEAQKVLLSSSDLSRVKVIRRDAKTGKNHEWIVDCSDHSLQTSQINVGGFPINVNTTTIPNGSSLQFSPDLWLRDGDVIEVPEKQ